MLSAAFLADMMSRKQNGIGKVCSIGNKADVDECDLLEYLIGDPETDAIALYLESISRGRQFAEIARKTTKPIVVLMGGKSETGARAAISHTASLSGNFRLLDDILTMSGVTIANDFHQLIDLVRALCMMPNVTSTCRTAILTISGGAGTLSCDLLEKHGLNVAQLSEKTREALKSIFPDWMPVANPVDLFATTEVHGRVSTYNRVIPIILEDPNVDVLLVHYVAGIEDEFPDLDALKKKADDARKVILFWLLGRQETTRSFHWVAQSRRIPVYWEISRAVECLSAAACFRSRETLDGTADSSILSLPDSGQQESFLDFSEGRVLDEYDSKHLLAKWHIPVVDEKLAHTFSEAEKAVQEMGFPVVLKGLLPGEIHKTDLGLICLGITAETELKDAYQRIQEKMESRGRILIQRQVRIDYELIAGFLLDDQFGPCVMFGLGGILAELQPDIVFSLAPLNHSTALKLIKRIRGKRLLEGFRGMAPLKEDLMAEILVRLGNLGTTYSQIEQIDINPVAVTAGFPLALDANIILNLKKN
jgi:acetyltransferase